MKKRYIFVALGLICVVLIAYIAYIVVALANLDEIEPREIKHPSDGFGYPISEGILSTGMKYEFHGEFDFHAFREEYGYYWQRSTDHVVIATTPTEAAEKGQFYLSPTLRSIEEKLEHIEGESEVIAVNYCTITGKWVIQFITPEAVRLLTLGEPPIYSINHTTGEVIEFSQNRGSVHIIEGRGGWQRTIGRSRPRVIRFIDSFLIASPKTIW